MLFYCPVYNLFTIIFTLQPYKADGVLLSLVVALDLWIWKQNHNINQITCSKIQNSCRRSVITDICLCVSAYARTHAHTHAPSETSNRQPTDCQGQEGSIKMNVSLAPPQRKGAVKFSLTIVLQDQTENCHSKQEIQLL